MFDDFAAEVLATEVKQRKAKSGYLKRCRGLALLTKISELGKDSSVGQCVILDMVVLTATPSDAANPNDINSIGENVAKWFKFQDGDAKKRSVVKADFKRQLCSIFGLDPSTLTEEQYKAMGKAAQEGKCEGMLLKYEPRVTEKGMVFHDFYAATGKNTPAQVAARIKAYNEGIPAKDLV